MILKKIKGIFKEKYNPKLLAQASAKVLI